jgi:hypothetical protein
MNALTSLLLVILFLTSTVSVGRNSEPEPPTVVSIVQLIATPERFDGTLVSLIGFIHIGREQDLVYLGEQDFNHGLIENALWFHLSEEMGKDWRKVNRNYVRIVAVFSARHEGPYGCPNGGLTSIKSFQIWSTPASPIGRFMDNPKPHE